MDRQFPSVFLLFSILWTSLPISHEDSNSCFDCSGKTDPFACNVIKQCAPNEKCFSTSYFLDSDPNQLWDFGCKDVGFCGLIQPNNNIGRKRNVFWNFTAEDRESLTLRDDGSSFGVQKRDLGSPSRINRLTSCNDCCHGDFCNQIPCDEESQKILPKGLVCHSCDAVSDPAMCTKTARCVVGELCAVWQLDNGMFGMGCKPKAVCDAQGNNLLFGKRSVGFELSLSEGESVDFSGQSHSKLLEGYNSVDVNDRAEPFHNVAKRQATTSNSRCRQCCLDNLCAATYCSKTNTLPPNVVTVTIPTTTTPPLLIRVLPHVVYTFEGDNATFVCDINGQPPLDVEYSRSFDSNATTIGIPSCNYQSSLRVTNKTCSFLFTKLSDSGIVTCSVTDSLGQSRTASARLQVEPYKNNVKPTVTPNDSDLFVGNKTVLKCAMTGIPIPFYEWFKNDSGTATPVVNSLEFNITSDGAVTVLEVTPNENSSIDGSYFCQGNNRLEKLNVPFTLTTISTVAIVTPPGDTTIDSSRNNYTFSCTFQSYPPPTITWGLFTSSNQTLTLSTNSSVSSVTQNRLTTAKAVVTFNELFTNDVKYVTCIGNNGYFQNRTRAEVELLEPPEITTPSKTYQLSYGQPVSLTCEAKGVPKPHISWNFVDMYDIPQILQGIDLKDGGKTLEVAHIRSAGKFLCYASNSLGSDSASFPVKLL